MGDHLNRINEQIFKGIKEDEAIINSIKTGDDLIEKFEDELRAMSSQNITIHRWQQYYNDNNVNIIKSKFINLFNMHKRFREEIQTCSMKFIGRQVKNGNALKIEEEAAIMLSCEYLIEEMAVFDVLIARGYRVQVYPGNQLNILKQFARGDFCDIDTNLINGIYVDLTVKKVGK